MPPSRPGYAKSPEALIVGLARLGERAAFQELVVRRQVWIRQLMYRCSGDPVLADDLAQQTFLNAWRDISKLRDPAQFGAWLKQVAMNVWRQHLRKHDPLRGAQEDNESAVPESSKIKMTQDLAMDLEHALSTLAPLVRTCIVLSYHEGMSHAEIADATQLSLGTVKSHVRRGSKALQQQLAAYINTPATDPPV